ncbi:hypothetical protein EYF80_045471 [Liparis tanakae]|uniref:Uncharacterized protein n=1 Tax=Liparis tanakae TaxID=230148 RepID=A0A4Z2FT14_9TELE|nr:hypothetical protein EYF80_045471 [Liparis tanakae]
MTSPGVFAEQGADEVFGLVRDLVEALLVELPLGGGDQGEGLGVGVTLEWRLAAQSEDRRRTLADSVCSKLSSTMRSNSSPPAMLRADGGRGYTCWRANQKRNVQDTHDDTHNSMTMTISGLWSYAARHWTSLGWWRKFISSISFRAASLSLARRPL